MEVKNDLITEENLPDDDKQAISYVDVLRTDGTVVCMPLDSYVAGVVLAEMPASFEYEALKAQSVASRTYALKRQQGNKHADADVCTKASCCQAYLDVDTFLTRGGTKEDFDRVFDAVAATTDYVLTYDGCLIEATYFSNSGGMTEDAVSVWGTEVPYLVAQESPGEEFAEKYIQTVSISEQELLQNLGIKGCESVVLGDTTHTPGGGVDTITICGQTFTGLQIRQMLQLQSTLFSMTRKDGSVTITVKGYGHRVGMSQYGAEAMALQGSDYRQILEYYYPGTQLTGVTTH